MAAGRMVCIIDYARGIDLSERTEKDLTRENCLITLQYARNRKPTTQIQEMMDEIPMTITQLIEMLEKRRVWDEGLVMMAYRSQRTNIKLIYIS